MKIAFLVNDIATEETVYTTTHLANEARKRGHDVFYVDLEGFSYRPDGDLMLRARLPKKRDHRSFAEYLKAVQADDAKVEELLTRDLDVLMLRNDPADDASDRPWAQTVGISFGREAVRRGVVVLNDPDGLSQAVDKSYFQLFPEKVRPKTLITRDAEQIRAFVAEQKDKVVLKPLQGSGGQSVFLVREDESANLNQMIEAVSRHGYVVAQEYVPAAAEGDVRLFLLNGRPLTVKGKIAAFRRVGAEGDLRSNMTAGGRAVAADVTDDQLAAAELVRPRLVRDGMFLVGLDLVGDKLLEVNVFSPGGLHSAQKTKKVDFLGAVIDAIEAKVEAHRHNPGTFVNRELATL